jgi:hypothetical protein
MLVWMQKPSLQITLEHIALVTAGDDALLKRFFRGYGARGICRCRTIDLRTLCQSRHFDKISSCNSFMSDVEVLRLATSAELDHIERELYESSELCDETSRALAAHAEQAQANRTELDGVAKDIEKSQKLLD